MSLPVYIYVTKQEPYLIKGATKYVLRNRNQIDGFTPPSLNGLVAFKCECKEAFKIEFCGTSIKNPAYFFPSIHAKEVLERSCLTEKQFLDYGKGKTLYALHFENFEPLGKPMEIGEFYSDEACTNPLTKAPQSWCYAYKKLICNEGSRITPDGVHNHNGYFFKGIECVICSIRPQWVLLEASKEPFTGKPCKDLETRKRIWKGLKTL